MKSIQPNNIPELSIRHKNTKNIKKKKKKNGEFSKHTQPKRDD